MERLSGLDASFLYIEGFDQPLAVCSILELDTSTMPGGYTFGRDLRAYRIRDTGSQQAAVGDVGD